MRGTIIHRGRTWSVVIDLGRDPATGKRTRKWHSGFRTRKEAEQARIQILSQLQRGEYVPPAKQKLAEFLAEDWLPSIRASVRESTWDSYRRTIELHVQPHIGSTQLQRLAPGQLNSLYAMLLTEGRADGRGGLSPRSVRYVHAIIHRALNDAVRWNRLARNPATAAEPPRADRDALAITTWTADQLRTFLSYVADDRLVAAWTLAATTGMRRGEILGLRWHDLDLDTAHLSVRQTLISVGYDIRVSTPKTVKGRRSIALDRTTVRALRSHRTRQLQEKLAIGHDYQDESLVFADSNGGYIHPDGFGKTFLRLQQQAGVPRIRFHDLRHTHATLALQAGIHPRVVSERLGHSTVAMTLDTYSHVLPGLQEEAAERVAELLFDQR